MVLQISVGVAPSQVPLIVFDTWRRITFIVTTRDRFEATEEIKYLLADELRSGRTSVTLKEQQVKFGDDEIG